MFFFISKNEMNAFTQQRKKGGILKHFQDYFRRVYMYKVIIT